jgi:putative DNA primase/helicase
MDAPELLIHRFELRDWMNPNYSGTDPAKRSTGIREDRYRGLLRCAPAGSARHGDIDSNEDSDANADLAA